MLEAVINVSEGRDRRIIDAIGGAAGRSLLDVHRVTRVVVAGPVGQPAFSAHAPALPKALHLQHP